MEGRRERERGREGKREGGEKEEGGKKKERKGGQSKFAHSTGSILTNQKQLGMQIIKRM